MAHIDNVDSSAGRMSVSYTGLRTLVIEKRALWSYRRDGSTSNLYLNGVHQSTKTNLTTQFNPTDFGRFSLGSNDNLHSVMDFYGFFLFNKALTDMEMKTMHLYLMKHFNI